jgi:hypothetical protein
MCAIICVCAIVHVLLCVCYCTCAVVCVCFRMCAIVCVLLCVRTCNQCMLYDGLTAITVRLPGRNSVCAVTTAIVCVLLRVCVPVTNA